MPELPEVETVRAALDTAARGQAISGVSISGKKMRWPIPKDIDKRISGGEITGLRRRGKYILLDIARPIHQAQVVMLIHLGMSGSVRIYDRASGRLSPKPHDHMVVDLAGGVQIVLNDPRRFGGVCLMASAAEATHPLLANMGIEPLGNRLDGRFLRAAFSNRTTSVKAALLDQRIIAGIGNIYASEACYLAAIHPARKAGRIGEARCQALADAIRQVLQAAIRAGGTSLRDHVQPGGEIGYFVQQLSTYGREGEPCLRCKTIPIRMIRQAGRATYYCPHCQH